jgi:erythromycin esterase-like protein
VPLLGAGLLLACSGGVATRTAAAQAAPPSAAARQARPADLDRVIGGAELVVFGESSHWDFGVHGFVNRLLRHLVETKGFRVFVLESAWGVDEATQAFLASDRTAPEGDEHFFLNAFGSPETVETLLWIRAWNRAHPDDPVRVAGYQPEQPVHDFAALWKYLATRPAADLAALRAATAPCKASTGEYTTELAFIGPMTKLRRAGQPAFPEPDRLACLKGISAIESYRQANAAALAGSPSAREAQLHLVSLRGFYEQITRVADAGVGGTLTPEQTAALGRDAYANVDRIRAEIFAGLRETRYAGKKMLLWMHNWHAARRSEEIAAGRGVDIPKGTTSIGSRLTSTHGDRLVTVGSVVPCDRCTAASATGLAERFRAVIGEGSCIVDFGAVPPEWRHLPVNEAGSLIEPLNDSAFTDVVLSRQFDAVYYQSASDTVLDRRAVAKK